MFEIKTGEHPFFEFDSLYYCSRYLITFLNIVTRFRGRVNINVVCMAETTDVFIVSVT